MKIVFMGTPQAAVPSLERLVADGHDVVAVYTQPDRPAGRGNKIVAPPVKQFAIEQGLSVFQPEKIKTDEALETFRSHSADVAVVVAYGRILPDSFLTAFPLGAINVHFSLLPKYRGAAPVNWAIVNGDTETGVTTMQMDAGLDTGPILLQETVEIGPDETSIELMERLSHLGGSLLSQTLDQLASITPQQQDESRATYAPILRREDGLVDWSLTASEIANRVRGFQPFPSTFSYLGGTKVTFWQASVEESIPDASGGEITDIRSDAIFIACGGGTALKVSELQPEGKRRMSVRDYLNGARIEAGMRFGQ